MIPIFRDGEVLGERINNDIRIPHTFRSLVLNDTTDPTDHYEIGWVQTSYAYDSITEPNAQRDGMEAYEPRRISALIRARGIIRAPSYAALHDKIDLLNATFDPINAYDADTGPESGKRGFRSYSFGYPTEDVASYPSGLIPMLYYVRARRIPVDTLTEHNGLSVPFELELEAADPRRYLQTLSSAQRTGAGVLVLDNTLASYPSWPIVTITITGGGSGKIRLASSHPQANRWYDLNLTGRIAGDVITVNMETREIKLNGVVNMSLWEGSASDSYYPVLVGSTTVTVVNTTGTLAGTVKFEWRRAFV